MTTNYKRYIQLLLIIIAAGSIYPLIYLRINYQETILQVFNITGSQLNTLYTVLGFVFILGYFPSGILCDKFSAKKLMIISLLGTGVGGIWFAQVPNYLSVVIIFAIWGVFAVFTFWSAHMKLVHMLAKPEEEGRFFGLLDGGRGVVEAILASIAVVIFSLFLKGSTNISDKQDALVEIIYMYSFVLIIVAVLITIFVTDSKQNRNIKSSAKKKLASEYGKKTFSKQMQLVLQNKSIFLMGGVIFTGYTVYWTIHFIGGFLENDIKISSITVATIMLVVMWMRPIGGIVGGLLADKFGKNKVLIISLLGGVIGLLLLSFLPLFTPDIVFYIVVVFLGFFLYMLRGTYWSLLGECNINPHVLGMSIGVVSFIGYLPDVLMPYVSNLLFTLFGTNGTTAYFLFSSFIGMCGIVCVIVFYLFRKNSSRT